MVWIPRSSRNNPEFRRAGPAISLGLNMSAGMIACTGLGYYFGRRAGRLEMGVLIGILLGLLYGAYEVWKVIRILQDRDSSDGPES